MYENPKNNSSTYNSKAIEILTKLYSVSNEEGLMRCIRYIADTYKRYLKFNFIKDDVILEIANLINNRKEAKICTDAIISYARVFYTKKQMKMIKRRLYNMYKIAIMMRIRLAAEALNNEGTVGNVTIPTD